MMSVIDRLPENIKKVAFLLVMLIFCYLLVLTAESFGPERTTVVSSGSAYAFDEENIELYTQATSTQLEPQQNTIEGFEVLSATDGMGGGGSNGCQAVSPQGCEAESLPFQPICSTTPVNIGLNDATETGNNGQSVTVAKNAVIEIWKVTSPMGLLSGIEDMSDSTYALKKDEVRFRSSSDLIDNVHIGSQSLAPESDELVEVIDTIPNVKFPIPEPFSINVKVDQSDVMQQDRVDKELESVLPPEVNRSTPNPGNTNSPADIITPFWSPPTKTIDPRNYGTPGCIDVSNIPFMPNQEVFETCANKRQPMDFVFAALVNAQQWAQCLLNEAQCAEMEIVGLLIDAIYGSSWTCNEEYCGDQFFDHGLATNLSPLDFNDYVETGFENNPEPVMKAEYVTTPCKIRVDYGQIYDIPCLWDVSPYRNLYETEAQMRYPGDPDMPTWEEFWSATLEEAERRGEACGL